MGEDRGGPDVERFGDAEACLSEAFGEAARATKEVGTGQHADKLAEPASRIKVPQTS